MNRDLKNATRSTRDMDEYLEVRSTQEIIDDIKASAGQETLRDQFAAHAVAGGFARETLPEYDLKALFGPDRAGIRREEIIAADAYRIADAMLARRRSPQVTTAAPETK